MTHRRALYWAAYPHATLMKHIVELPGPAIVNRAVHTMAVIVIVLFAFHFARLSGFSLAAIGLAALVAILAAGSFGLRRSISVNTNTRHVERAVTLFSFPLHIQRTNLAGITWSGVRSDLPDLVVEVGTPADETAEVLRFRSAYGKEKDAIDACTKLAEALNIEDRGYRE